MDMICINLKIGAKWLQDDKPAAVSNSYGNVLKAMVYYKKTRSHATRCCPIRWAFISLS